MPQSTLTYILSYIRQNIPSELLQLAFRPRQYSTTVEQRIISEIIEGPILQDTNLVGGKRREIFIQPEWKINLPVADTFNVVGTGVESSFYLIPATARENRNISSVIGVTPYLGSSFPGAIDNNGSSLSGNNAMGMLSQMINSRTFSQNAVTPQVTLEGTNIVRFYPELFIEGVALSVMLENDAEFLNANQSMIVSLRKLCLCAVKRYIATKLRVSIDETEVVAGMEIGIIKSLVDKYAEEGENYDALLVQVKGAMHYDPKSMSRLIYYAL